MCRKSSFASLALFTAVASGASAALNIDLRATSYNGGALPPGSDFHHVGLFPPRPGDVVRFDVFAVVTGTNASTADERFISATGSFVSTSPSTAKVFGDLSLSVVQSTVETPGFDAPGYSIGMQQDLDGDGDIDVGGTNDSSDAGFWSARYLTGSPGAPAGLPVGRLIGQGTFTVTGTTTGGPTLSFTLLQFVSQNAPLAVAYIQDGMEVHEEAQSTLIPLEVGFSGEIPEPSSVLSISALTAGIALARRRRAR